MHKDSLYKTCLSSALLLLGMSVISEAQAQNTTQDTSESSTSSQGVGDLISILKTLEQKPSLEGPNGGLSKEHRRILDTLATASPSSAIITYKQNTYTLPPATPETLRYMGLFKGSVNYNEMWAADAAGLTDFIDVYLTSPKNRKNIKNFISGKVYTAWQQSTIGNGYKPVAEVIRGFYARLELLPEPQKTNARQLFYDATKAADVYVNDQIADFMYNAICYEPCRSAPRYQLTVDKISY